MKSNNKLYLIIISCLLIGVGIFKGDANSVFLKATKICLECIGIA